MPAYVHSDCGNAFMSYEFHSKGITSSRITSNNPFGTQWHDMEGSYFVMHFCSIRTLFCVSTNKIPHECLVVFQRRSASESLIPSLLATPGPVLLKRYVRLYKFDPLVDKVELIEAHLQYAHIRFSDGKEDTVALLHLALKNVDEDHTNETLSRGRKPEQKNMSRRQALV